MSPNLNMTVYVPGSARGPWPPPAPPKPPPRPGAASAGYGLGSLHDDLHFRREPAGSATPGRHIPVLRRTLHEGKGVGGSSASCAPDGTASQGGDNPLDISGKEHVPRPLQHLPVPAGRHHGIHQLPDPLNRPDAVLELLLRLGRRRRRCAPEVPRVSMDSRRGRGVGPVDHLPSFVQDGDLGPGPGRAAPLGAPRPASPDPPIR
jgi:hypothetical protein